MKSGSSSAPRSRSNSLLSICILGTLLTCLSASAQTWFSLQEGDVRSGSDSATVNTSGTLISSSYVTHATHISSGNAAVNFNGSTNLIQGTLGSDYNRVLLGFDLAPIANYVSGQAYTLASGNLAMTYRTNGTPSPSTMALYNTSAFNETNATWSTPGPGVVAGGDLGASITSMSVVSNAYPAVLNWSGANLNLAIANALANPTNKTLYLMLKRGTENTGNYAQRFVTDENADPIYGGIDSRPELKLQVSILSNAPLVSVSAADPSAIENGNGGELGTDTATFTITRSVNLTNSLTVNFFYGGPAIRDGDYTASVGSPVTLPPNVASTNIVITPLGDTTPEDDETVTLNIGGGGVNYGIAIGTASVSIHDDNDGGALAQYFFGNSFAPQVWNSDATASVATFPGLSATFSGFNLSPPASFQALNSLTGSNEVAAISRSNLISVVVAPKFGHTVTLTNVEVSTMYYNTQSPDAQQGVLFVRSSLDNFATTLGAVTNFAVPYFDWQTLSIPLGPEFSSHLGNIEFRLYLYDDVNDATLDAAMRVDNLYIRGDVAPLSGGVQQIAIAATSPNAAEPSAPGAFSISRAGDLAAALEVNYLVGGSASNGVDYAFLSGLATIPAGASSTVVTVSTIDDLLAEGPETVVLTLQTNTNQFLFGPATATVTIADNAEPTQLGLAATDNNAYERLSSLTGQFRIGRAGATNGSTTANFSFTGTAALGVDFTSSATNSVDFASGETVKSVDITPINNTLVDGTRTVVLTIAPDAGYLLLDGTNATVSIYDDELPTETVLFSDAFETTASANNYVVLEAARDEGAPDSIVDYSFDYSTIGLTPAPGSMTTKGLRVTVNKGGTNQGAAINFFPVNLVVSNNYALRFNLFEQWNPAANFVEQALAGINHSGTLMNWNYSTVQVTAIMGDGQFVGFGNTVSDPIAFFFTATNIGSAPLRTQVNRTVVAGTFNNPPYGDPGGLPGVIGCAASSSTKSWVDCEVSQVDGIVRVKANGATLFTYTNSSPFTSGRVMIGYMDVYDSLGPVENFAIFDNVRVVQLPATATAPPMIGQITVSGGTVTIAFSGAATDTAGSFKLQSSTVPNTGYSDDNSAVITGSGGVFQATTAVDGPARFYRIRRN